MSSKYIDIKKIYQQIKSADGVADTVFASAAMVGAVGFNIGKFALTEALPSILEKQADSVFKNERSTDEQREKAENARSKAQEIRDQYK